MSSALDGIVVLDLTRRFSGSLASAFLGDFGARVIRLDLLPLKPTQHEGGWNYEADLIHRNKQSLAVDPKDPRGAAILRQLMGKVDVVVTDWERPDLVAAGFTYTEAAAEKSDIIFARLSGFGPVGPDRDLPTIDELAAARCGLMPVLPQLGQPPAYTAAGIAHAAVMLALGVMTALFHRDVSGEGQEVDVSLFGANIYSATMDVGAVLAMGPIERLLTPVKMTDPYNPIMGALYATADGYWVMLTMPDTERWWRGFCAVVGLSPDDSRYNSHDKRTATNREELIRELVSIFRSQPASYWRPIFEKNQVPCNIYENFSYPANDPQASLNRYVIELDHPSFGKIKSMGFPVYMSDTTARLNSLAPCTGQHTAQVLSELLGYPEANIFDLTAAGVVG